MSEYDFLDEQKGLDNKEAQHTAALEFAKLYTVFVLDERAKKILDHWDKTIRRKRTLPSASHAEFAFAEAQRAFVEGIHEQIHFAQTNGRG